MRLTVHLLSSPAPNGEVSRRFLMIVETIVRVRSVSNPLMSGRVSGSCRCPPDGHLRFTRLPACNQRSLPAGALAAGAGGLVVTPV